jgi:hypothetical protein
MRTAYYCLSISIDTGFVCGAGIYSAPPWGLTSRGRSIFALVYEIKRDSFDEANKCMLHMLECLPDFHYVKKTALEYGVIRPNSALDRQERPITETGCVRPQRVGEK